MRFPPPENNCSSHIQDFDCEPVKMTLRASSLAGTTLSNSRRVNCLIMGCEKLMNAERFSKAAIDVDTERPSVAESAIVNGATNSDSPKVLSIDIGGSSLKMLATGQVEPIKMQSGPDFTPANLLAAIKKLPSEWQYEVVTIGFPGLVGRSGPVGEPGNLGAGWVGFDFADALGKPVKVLNDAAMQAIGSYDGGRMLFIGLGTGVGSSFIVDHSVVMLELGNLRWNSRMTCGELLSKRSLSKLGVRKWRKASIEIMQSLMHSFVSDYLVVGGGNAKLLNSLPPGVRLGNNRTAFRGGFRVWDEDSKDKWKIL